MAKYTKRVGFYLNVQEKENLDRQVAQAGLNVSQYMRHLISTSDLKPYPENHAQEITGKIKVIGDEINEITKAANSRGFVKVEEIHRVQQLQSNLLNLLQEECL